MEGPFLEWQQSGPRGVRSRALREHEEAAASSLEVFESLVEHTDGLLAVGSVQEKGARQSHEPAQKRHQLKLFLGRHDTTFGKYPAQHKHVKLGLVVGDQNGGQTTQFLLTLDFYRDAHNRAKQIVVEARSAPLGQIAFANQRENHGAEDTVRCADHQGAKGNKTLGVKLEVFSNFLQKRHLGHWLGGVRYKHPRNEAAKD
ncbi:hypothetical protein OGATHE_003011 [Ogataea polymorpha]|uniref:Uncharacterized protein n=1 Tax=Ogataea polymorpha TaxID=460523 RepID=A0A9P8PDE7_9ASCO|nr:hypothetical protein OGATHE_003011 [Ogataea polymorpha]